MKKLLFLLFVILAAYLFWRWWRADELPAARGQELFYDRLWVDHMPKNETDTFQIFVAVTEQPVGVFQSASQWKGAYEMFRYEARGDGKLELVFPQTRSREKSGNTSRRHRPTSSLLPRNLRYDGLARL